jgi:hypothetical protein
MTARSRQQMDVFPADASSAPPSIFSRRWRSDVARLLRLFLPHRTVWLAGLFAQLVAAPISSLCLVVVGRAFNGFYLPIHGGELRAQLRTYAQTLCLGHQPCHALQVLRRYMLRLLRRLHR